MLQVTGVSFVMPVLNEAGYLREAVASVLSQRLSVPMELVLALGPSTDGTTELARQIALEDPRVSLVDNPRADIPVGLNAAISASRFPVIIRVDAHSELSDDYAADALETLERTGAANVGGVMHAAGRTPFQKTVAWAYNSPIGLGGGAYHGSAQAGPAESAYLGVMRREVVEAVGGFDESIRRGEDWELNLRIREAGHTVWFDPRLRVTYWPRASFGQLLRQFFATGTWRGELVRRLGARNSLRFFAPPALVIALVAAVVLGVLQLTAVVSGVASVWASIIYLPTVLYALLLLALVIVRRGAGLGERLWTLAVLPGMHISWGCGFLLGVTRGAGRSVDTSRVISAE